MAYYITAEEKRGKYVPLKITSSERFERSSNLKGDGASLAEIDKLTMQFNNESELRKALHKEGILTMRHTRSKLSIRMLQGGLYKKISYDFLYKKDLEYVTNPKLIIKRINDALYDKDFRFISMYANHYLNYYDCGSTAAEVREAAFSSMCTNQISKHFYIRDESGDALLTRMTKLLIYKYNQAPSGRVEYQNIVKYNNLHSIIAFINNYNKKYSEELITDNTDKIEYSEELTTNNTDNREYSLFEQEVAKPKTKTRKKEKNPCIDGQITFF